MIRLRALVVAVALTAGATPAFAARWPEWADLPPTTMLSARAADADAVVVSDRRTLRLKAGRRTGQRRRVVQILTDEGRDQGRVILVRGDWDRFDRVKIWVRFPSGRIVRYDEDDGTLFSNFDVRTIDSTEVVWIQPPGLVAGCAVAMQYDFSSTADLPGDLIPFQEDVPVLFASVSAEAERGWSIAARWAGGALNGPAEVRDRGVWEARDVPAREDPRSGSAPATPRLVLSLSYVEPDGGASFADWPSVSRWGIDLFRPALTGETLVDSGAGRAAPLPDAAVEEAVLDARRLRYFALELGWGGYVPRQTAITRRRGFGDCKDKSVYLVALLRRMGEDAFPVLAVAGRSRYVHESLPTPRQFNHCIAGVRWDRRARSPKMTVVDVPGIGAVRLIDPTLRDDARLDTFGLDGGTGLPLDGRASSIFRFPKATASDNVLSTSHSWRLEEDRGVSDTMIRSYGGVWQSSIAAPSGRFPSGGPLRRRVLDGLGARIADPDTLEVSVQGAEIDRWAFRATYRSTVATWDFGDLLVFPLLDLAEPATVPVPALDGVASEFTFPLRVVDSHEFVLEEVAAGTLPTPFENCNALGCARLRVERSASTARVAREIDLEVGEVRVQDTPLAEELRSALRRLNAVRVVFRARVNPGSSGTGATRSTAR